MSVNKSVNMSVKNKPEQPQRGSQGRFQSALPTFDAKLKNQCDAMIMIEKTPYEFRLKYQFGFKSA